ISAVLAQNALSVLTTPASSIEVAKWLDDLDRKAKTLANLAVRQGRRATHKLYAEDANRTLNAGWDFVLSIIIRSIPSIDWRRVDVDEFCAFLTDDETKRKRARLFDWHKEIDVRMPSRQLSPEDIIGGIEAALEDYVAWIARPHFPARNSVGELLIT